MYQLLLLLNDCFYLKKHIPAISRECTSRESSVDVAVGHPMARYQLPEGRSEGDDDGSPLARRRHRRVNQPCGGSGEVQSKRDYERKYFVLIGTI
jgi:hypothetical protein